MTAAEAAIRQAQHENVFTSALRPETIREIESVLNRIREIDASSFTTGDLDAFRDFGALRWAAFAALMSMQADQKVYEQYGRTLS